MLQELLTELNTLDEHPSLEAKACQGDQLGNSFFETVCSFHNEPGLGGGQIVLGVSRDEADFFGPYEAHGVGDANKIQNDIATGCAGRFNIPVRPRVTVEEYQGAILLIVEVSEGGQGDKPLFFKKHGLPQGAWRRIGSSDQRCTEEDMVVFYGNRGGESYDLTELGNATLDDLDPDAIEYYRELRQRINPEAEELHWNDQDLLQALNAIREQESIWRPTLTGLLLFGTRMALRRELPMVRVDYIRVSGNEWVSDPDKRFEKTIDMRGPIISLVDRVQAAIMDDLPKGFELEEGQTQAKTPTLPARVLREAIVNALMHRSYREHQPTQVIRYSNRIEIRNAGFSLKNEESLGETGSQLRNPHLAAVFHETNTAETKGSGIRTMRVLMAENGFSLPTFESNRGENYFVSRLLLHHFLSEQDMVWLATVPLDLTELQKNALIFLREQGAIDNKSLRQLTGCDILSASHDLRKLRDAKILEQKGKGPATYYVPGEKFPQRQMQSSEHETLGGEHVTLSGEHVTLEGKHVTLESDSAPPSEELLAMLAKLSKRPGDKIRPVIQAFCAWRPHTAAELAKRFGKPDSNALKRDHLTPMVRESELFYTYPEMERHPQQAYTYPAP